MTIDPRVDARWLAAAAATTGLDRVRAVESGRSGAAVRHVPSTWPLLATHFPRFPVLPGVLLLADLAALAALVAMADPGWLPPHSAPMLGRDPLYAKSDNKGPFLALGGLPALAGVTRVRWRRYVSPGDVVELAVEAVRPLAYRGMATVDGRSVGTVGELRLRPVLAEVEREPVAVAS
ncbi:hypothetical protein WEI85_09265 [Actinomycetes bacterium KLBMP 9797]